MTGDQHLLTVSLTVWDEEAHTLAVVDEIQERMTEAVTRTLRSLVNDWTWEVHPVALVHRVEPDPTNSDQDTGSDADSAAPFEPPEEAAVVLVWGDGGIQILFDAEGTRGDHTFARSVLQRHLMADRLRHWASEIDSEIDSGLMRWSGAADFEGTTGGGTMNWSGS